jgi:hypothetical protein
LLVCELGGFGVVGFDFCPDHRAVGIGVLWLHACNQLRVSTDARRLRGQRPSPEVTVLGMVKDDL